MLRGALVGDALIDLVGIGCGVLEVVAAIAVLKPMESGARESLWMTWGMVKTSLGAAFSLLAKEPVFVWPQNLF
jgi:hypothetical protein